MRSVLSFIGKHWLTLGLLAGSLVLVIWIVNTQRAPGSMTVVEAQAMDMTTSKPPPGVQPVAVEEVASRTIGGTAVYPAVVAALSDEDVVARVPGRVSAIMVYPGDRVRAGQLVAKIEAGEYASQAGEAKLMASSKLAMAISASREVDSRRAMLAKANATLDAARATQGRSQADAEAMVAEQLQAKSELAMAEADVKAMQADARYADQNLAREQKLYAAGAISLDELQMATKERDATQAKVAAAQAKTRSAQNMAQAAAKKAIAAKRMVKESDAMIGAMRAEVAQNRSAISQAQEMLRASRLEAASASAGARGMATMAGYRELRALANGVVSERTVSPGTAVGMGQTILKLKVVDTVRVQADLPQDMFAVVKEGTPVTVKAGGKSRAGTVSSVFPIVDEASRTFKVEARITNPDHAFAAGMYAQLEVATSAGKESLAVRSAAVLTDSAGARYVWTLSEKADTGVVTDWTCTMHPEVSEKGPGKCPKCGMDLVPRERSGKYVAAKREVEVGATDDVYTAITSGLKLGEKVIWAGHENLQPGMAVQPTEWGPDGPKTLPGVTGDGMPGMDMGATERKTRDADREADPKSLPLDGGGKVGVDARPRQTHSPRTAHPVAAAYICPMKCKGSESDKPGKCPVCKMDLVKAETLKEGGDEN